MAIHRIESQVTGTVWKVECQAGAGLAEGETILIIESMKMEIPVDAPAGGVHWGAWSDAAHADYEAWRAAPVVEPLDLAQVGDGPAQPFLMQRAQLFRTIKRRETVKCGHFYRVRHGHGGAYNVHR